MSNFDVNRTVWDTLLLSTSDQPADICGEAIDQILRHAAYTRSLDNVTGVLVAFHNFSKYETGIKSRFTNNGNLSDADLDKEAGVNVGELIAKPSMDGSSGGYQGNRTPAAPNAGTGGTNSRQNPSQSPNKREANPSSNPSGGIGYHTSNRNQY